MSDRQFPEVDIGRDGERVRAHEIRCGVCGAVAYYAFKRGVEFRPAHAVATHFRAEGWHVGPRTRKDRCPLHASAAREPKPETSPEQEKTPMTTPAKGAAAIPAAPKADPPREMTFAERRMILMQLGEVYGNAAYLPGWTDKRVASELKYPPAWVRKLREENFGPEGSNPVIDEFRKSYDPFHAEYEAVLALSIKHFESGQELRRRIDGLSSTGRDLAGLAKRVEKEIGR